MSQYEMDRHQYFGRSTYQEAVVSISRQIMTRNNTIDVLCMSITDVLHQLYAADKTATYRDTRVELVRSYHDNCVSIRVSAQVIPTASPMQPVGYVG